ncbi:hypothetical protein [Saccharothrix violaceirubra]|uniref:APA family basic amino acid/polyamine antiporter n=1 Tax=Saccharothrix violaceirubra TaxID=413306 RepID=A0A7W7WYI9_9PSEU|nr:hypothetical protein [Saccharothrix violaceirubra]MBB4967758.1 APA family basic amino acid/polyamine antiporter [Saccharothrix violaceirubra]
MTFTPRVAVVSALGGALGAGVFAGFAPAALLAGPWFLPALVLPACVALLSGFGAADQARADGDAGGHGFAYARLGRLPARLSGVAHLIGRAGVAAALAGTFAAYVLPEYRTPAALAVLIASVASNGVRAPRRSAAAAAVFVLGVLLLVGVVCLAVPPPENPALAGSPQVMGVLGAASVLFVAFLGFERVSGAESARAAVPLFVGALLVITAFTGYAVLHQLGPARLGLSRAPLRDALVVADGRWLVPLLGLAVTVAVLAVLRHVFATARRTLTALVAVGDLPPVRGRVPLDILTAACAALCVVLASPTTALAIGACAMALHYGFTNAAARILRKEDRTWPTRTACFGLGLSVLLAICAPFDALVVTIASLLVGVAALALRGPLTPRRRS